MSDITGTKFKSSIAVCYGDTIVHDEDGRTLVVAVGYKDDKLGYFICKENRAKYKDDEFWCYEYTDIVSFTPKTDNDTYQLVLNAFEVLYPVWVSTRFD